MAGSFGVMALAALVTVGGLGAQAADAPGFIRVLPEDVRWTPMANTPGVMIAILAGDPGRAGPYVVRVKFPAHVMDTPHFHSADRYVTVLKGTWYAGTGKQFDPRRRSLCRRAAICFTLPAARIGTALTAARTSSSKSLESDPSQPAKLIQKQQNG